MAEFQLSLNLPVPRPAVGPFLEFAEYTFNRVQRECEPVEWVEEFWKSFWPGPFSDCPPGASNLTPEDRKLLTDVEEQLEARLVRILEMKYPEAFKNG